MKEIFREPDFTIVGYYQSVLEGAGIRTMIRNETLAMIGVTDVPIPDVFPALCVVDDADYLPAMALIRETRQRNLANSEEEVICASCGEINPGNFDVCWSCEAAIGGELE